MAADVHSALTAPARLLAAQRLGLLDPLADETLDHLTALARSALRVAVTAVAVTDGERHSFRSAAGTGAAEDSPLARSPCSDVIETGQPLAIDDAGEATLSRDRRSLAELGYPAFAGAPVRSRDGQVVATLCALDKTPRRWQEEDLVLLEQLAGAIVAHLELAAALRVREERYRLALGVAADGVVTIDTRSRILFTNPALERMFGYTRAELLGHPLTLLMPDDFRPRHTAALARYLETGQRTLSWDGVELTGRHKSGRDIPIEVSFAEGSTAGERFFTGIIRDLSKRRAPRKSRRSAGGSA
jgi:PAS domain S-box-containing protein